jgi:hypothetical protein
MEALPCVSKSVTFYNVFNHHENTRSIAGWRFLERWKKDKDQHDKKEEF